MAPNLSCAVGVPNVGTFGDPSLLVELAVAAEEHGWDGFFLWDHQLYWDPQWAVADPVVVIAAVAARTARVRLGILVNVLARRRVGKVARESVTLDRLSRGRLVFGAEDPKGGAVVHGPRFFEQPTCHWRPEVVGGILARESGELLRAFFRERRGRP